MSLPHACIWKVALLLPQNQSQFLHPQHQQADRIVAPSVMVVHKRGLAVLCLGMPLWCVSLAACALYYIRSKICSKTVRVRSG
jgi:hypothetical protein